MQFSANGRVSRAVGTPPIDPKEGLMTQILAAQKPLYSYIRSLVSSVACVDDILQEVNLVLWRRGHEYDGRSPFLAWACHVAYIQVLAHYQKLRREKNFYYDESVMADLAEYVSVEVEQIDARLEALRACLAKLSPSQRQMILSRYESGGSVQSVAGDVARPAGSVRVALHRIRQLLADCIARTLSAGGGL